MVLAPSAVQEHFLTPCMLFSRREEHTVTTVLGSCVSVCLWDAERGWGGMNHYMLPLWNGEGLPTPKYGNIAIEKLIQQVIALGCRKENLVAKIFGGANVLGVEGPGTYQIGERNVTVAQELLAQHGIPIVASKVGGTSGMKILFNTRTGSVLVGMLRKTGGEPPPLPDGRPRASRTPG